MLSRKWSRREESDFYRTVSSYGVEYDRKTDTFEWTKFRTFSRLDKKLDETLTEYFKAFYAMCKRVAGRKLTEEEENLPISVDPISEERASRCLIRIDLLSKVREEILPHPELDERLFLCQPSIDLPDWWVCGKHDKDLLIGAAKYGLNRLDFNVMQDNELSFKEVMRQVEEAQKPAESQKDEIKKESDNELKSEDTKETQEPSAEAVKQELSSEMCTDVKNEDSVQEKIVINGVDKSEKLLSSNEEETIEKDTVEKTDKAEEVAKTNLEPDLSHNGTIKEKEAVEDIPSENDVPIESDIPNEKTQKPDNFDVQLEKTTNGEDVADKETVKINGFKESDDEAGHESEKPDSLKSKLEEETKQSVSEASETTNENGETEIPEVNANTGDSSEQPKEEENVELDKEAEVDAESDNKKAVTGNATSEVEDDTAKEPAIEETADAGSSENIAVNELEQEDEPKESENVDTENEKVDLKSTESESESKTQDESSVAVQTPVTQTLPIVKPFRWPKDRVLQMRLEQICHCVEKNEWPSLRHSFLPNSTGTPVTSTPSVATADSSPRAVSPGSLSSVSREPTPHPTPEHTPRRESMSPPLPDYFFDNGSVSRAFYHNVFSLIKIINFCRVTRIEGDVGVGNDSKLKQKEVGFKKSHLLFIPI